MKKLTLCMMTAFLLLSFISTPLKAVTGAGPVPMDSTRTVESAVVNALVARLDEIKALDKSDMGRPEKKALRKEARSIKSQIAERGGIYISVGALLIVIILLILLL